MLMVMLAPAICFAFGMILAGTHSRLSRLDGCALAAGLCPVTLGTFLAVWAVTVLFSMSGLWN